MPRVRIVRVPVGLLRLSNQQDKQRVLDAIKQTPCISKEQIADATGLTVNEVIPALRELKSVCHIEETVIGSETYRLIGFRSLLQLILESLAAEFKSANGHPRRCFVVRGNELYGDH